MSTSVPASARPPLEGQRRIEIQVGDASATYRLLERLAPQATAALYDSLPLHGEITHARWAGSACWFKVEGKPLSEVIELENPVTSIYRGTLALRPSSRGRAELFLSYGQAESRHDQGRTYVTPLARVDSDASDLNEALAATWKSGSAAIEVRRVEEPS